MTSVERRRFLKSTAVIGGVGIGLLAGSRAFGFSVEEPGADVEGLILNHCKANNVYHEELVAELAAKLKGHPEAEIRAALAATVCPICGCPIA